MVMVMVVPYDMVGWRIGDWWWTIRYGSCVLVDSSFFFMLSFMYEYGIFIEQLDN